MLAGAVRWLGLDIGAARVGVAVCDEAEAVVTPLSTIPFRGPADLARRVAAMAAERGCRGVALGLPRTASGVSRGERRVAEVARELRRQGDLQVVLVDEVGTTREAKQRLAEAGHWGRRLAARLDGVAAAIILEELLQTRRAGACAAPAVDLDGGQC